MKDDLNDELDNQEIRLLDNYDEIKSRLYKRGLKNTLANNTLLDIILKIGETLGSIKVYRNKLKEFNETGHKSD